MGIITKQILVAKDKRTLQWYEKLNYEFNIKKPNSNYRYALVDVKDLHPKSRAKIECSCEICGKIREVSFNQYRDICHDCSNKQPTKEETKLKISESNKGKRIGNKNPMWKGGKPKCKVCGKTLKTWRGTLCKECFLKREQSGENNSNWKDYPLKDEIRKLRKSKYNRIWVKEVKEKYNYTCDVCGSKENLHSHHLYNWADYPDYRFELDNGVCLCKKCHFEFHKIYGKKNNTKEEYLEYKNYKKGN